MRGQRLRPHREIESALGSLDALTAEPGSDPYRRLAVLEHARLAT